MDYIQRLRAHVEKKNLLATVIPVLALLWFVLLSYESGGKSYYSFTWVVVLAAAIACLFGTVSIAADIGTGAFIPLAFTFLMAAIGLYHNDIDIFWDVTGWVSLPYFMVLCAMLFKRDGVSASSHLHFAPLTPATVKRVIGQRNTAVNALLALSVLVTAFFSYSGIWHLLTAIMEQAAFTFAFSLWIVGMLIGLGVIFLGYRWGCGCVWVVSIPIFVCAWGIEDFALSGLIFLAAASMQGLLLIKKKGRTAFSVMA